MRDDADVSDHDPMCARLALATALVIWLVGGTLLLKVMFP